MESNTPMKRYMRGEISPTRYVQEVRKEASKELETELDKAERRWQEERVATGPSALESSVSVIEIDL